MNNSNVSAFDAPNLAIVSILSTVQIILSSLTVLLAFAYTALIVHRSTFRHNKLNWLTVNVCLASALFCIFMLILNITQKINVSSSLSCRLQGFLIDMTICQILYSHCVASFCRLVAIIHATKHLFRSSAFTWICMGAGWLVSVLAAIPYLFLGGFACPPAEQADFLSYYTILATLLLPMTIVGVCNFRILSFVRRSTRQVHAEAPKNKGTHARDIQLMKTLIGTFVIIVVGWSPIFFLQTIVKGAVLPTAVSICIQILPSVSMLLDVFLLIYTNQPVRLFLKQLILRKGPPPNPTNVH